MAALGYATGCIGDLVERGDSGIRRLHRLRRRQDSSSRISQPPAAAEKAGSRTLRSISRFSDRCEHGSRARRAECRNPQRIAQETARPIRPRSHPNSLRSRLNLGRRRRETWTSTSLLLVARHLALLHSAGRGGDLLESPDAARGWHLSMGETWLQRVRRFYRGVESLAALDHGHRVGRNVYDHEHFLRHWSERGVDAEQQMVRIANQLGAGCWSWLGLRPRVVIRQMAAQRWRLRHASGLWRADLPAAAWPHAGRIEKLSATPARAADDVDLLLLQHFQQTFRRRVERI